MDPIRVAWGSGTGPTAMASFDAALAEANVHEYNLVELSSVVPADATLDVVGTVPDLGPTGEALYCVLARETVPPGAADPAVAGLGWARGDDGRGVFYERGGRDPAGVREAVEDGLDHGMVLRDREPVTGDVVVETVDADPAAHATAVVVAAYGRSEPLLE